MRYSVLIAACLCSSPALADKLWLSNGDVLTGKILYMTDDSLLFDAAATGRVSIAWKKVSTLSSDEPLKIVRKQKGTEDARFVLGRGEPGRVTIPGGEGLALADIKRLLRPRTRHRDWLFEGNLDLSSDIKRERDDKSNSIETRLDTRIIDLDWRHVLRGDYTYETQEGFESERNYSAEYNLDYFFREPWYWRMHVLSERDYFDDNKRDNEYGTGPGYQFWDDEQGRFGVNVTYLRYRFARDFEEEPVTDPRLRLNAAGLEWELKQALLGTDIEVHASGNIFFPDSYGITYLLKSNTGLRYYLNGRINLSFNLEHDALKADELVETSDDFTVGIGVKW